MTLSRAGLLHAARQALLSLSDGVALQLWRPIDQRLPHPRLVA
jgi:hypothetical protein